MNGDFIRWTPGEVSVFCDNKDFYILCKEECMGVLICETCLLYTSNSLVNKKYVERRRSEEDRRVVFVKLTDRGVKAYRHHEDYHRQMTRAILDKLDEAEIPVLVKTLDALSEFFTGYSKNRSQ